ncbi:MULTISPECIES: aminotransferase class IV [unclassified Leeuwenhoekiella]|uniref:aminotransferase class IV n=1 Tax=unclassified Leeuwenhoekiella TaxID=2615029 RepID=UPI000C5E5C1F|nr:MULTISPECIES: aminotransferase class IV [unclassified Leeuwenhoekiella]MAW93707.1 aminotransferase class IV [Leeuwenhoekiella sp.]MBA83069.1 aminotransferase class IV [Leeuwenhoekiella sp.]|tara:strand:+ start:41646 stop:42485 length:840 start_codon:yes stop_codon:yes gene_type:complete
MVNFNGTLTENPQFSPNNRGMFYGDAVFETLRYTGDKIAFWEDHYFRLMASMRILRMQIPMHFTPEYFQDELLKLLEACDLVGSPARLRLTVIRNEGGTYLPEDKGVFYYALASKLDNAFYILNDAPYEVELYKDHYLNADLLSTLKTANKLINVTGSIFAEENGFQNCLLLNTNKSVAEALNGNLFLVKGKTIKTPPLSDGCLRGIVRKQLIEIIEKLENYTLEESPISPFELQKADELFITNTITGIQPITKYRKKSYTNTVAKDLLGKLNAKVRLG